MNDLDAYMFYRHSRAVIEGRNTQVRGSDGYPLAVTLFEGPSSKRTLVVASATGVLRSYYATFAAWLASRGTRVVTFDYRGIGDSRPTSLRGFEASMLSWASDLGSVLSWTTKTYGRPSVIGHSVGGQLVGLLPDVSMLRSAVFVASQCGDYRLWPEAWRRAWYFTLWHAVVPSVTSAVGYLPGSLGIGQDLPAGVALEWARWCRTPGYMVGGPTGEARREGYRRLTTPLLAYGFDDDDYAPPAAVTALLELYENASITRRQLAAKEPIGHFGFFRDRHKGTLWQETAEFLERG
jgi:predicted alpha/beta hydrolase